MFLIMFVIIFLIYSTLNYMIAKSTFIWLRIMFPNMLAWPFYTIYVILALSIVFMYLLPTKFSFQRIVAFISYYWMGIFFYSFLIIGIALIILGIVSKMNLISSHSLNHIILVTGWIVFILIISILIYGRVNALNIKNTSYDIKINKVSDLDKLNVVLISDLHLGHINNAKHLKKIIKMINVKKPDIVFLAGDIFDGDYNAVYDADDIKKLLDNIESKYGVYACLGNHDAGNTYKDMALFLENSSIHVLMDEAIEIDHKFVVIGRRDSRPIGDSGEKRVKSLVVDKKHYKLPIIVLEHQPSNLKEYNNNVDLILSGHTHKGQVFPAGLITNAIFDVDYGYYQKNRNTPQVIVTSGVGTWGPPLRVGTKSEVVQINITFKR